MPFTLSLPSGSPWSSLASASRLSCRSLGPPLPPSIASSSARSCRPSCPPHSNRRPLLGARCFSEARAIPDPPSPDLSQHVTEQPSGTGAKNKTRPVRLLPSRQAMHARRQSQPAFVLDAIHGPSRHLYAQTPPGKLDLSYTSPRRRGVGGMRRRPKAAEDTPTQKEGPLSLYNILARYLQASTMSPWRASEFQFTEQELAFLESKGYSQRNVVEWATFIVNLGSPSTTKRFFLGHSTPPLFVVLLFLRRAHISKTTLGILMQHVLQRLRVERISWQVLKILVVRLLRHARVTWPESIPWISALFTAETRIVMGNATIKGRLPVPLLSDITHFCNAFLALLSLPASAQPIISAPHQQNAQFEVLRFMASRTPALIVTRVGFRAATRIQLAHAKTDRERDWAQLKGTSWPPWRRKRTAMDEDKGYEYGASRASRIIHRMHEAGYISGKWEEIAQLYAGWDTDLSPTIQTRTLMPDVSITAKHRHRLGHFLWAARVRATRTRREAWACFLAWEAAKEPPSSLVYLAMFEKLCSSEMQRPEDEPKNSFSDEHDKASVLLPGDTKEVLPEPKSSVDLIYIAEPVPSYEQFYDRMNEQGVRPNNRMLAFLLKTSPDFSIGLELLQSTEGTRFHENLQRLLDGSIIHHPKDHYPPDYLLAAFICHLCRHGRYSHAPVVGSMDTSLKKHEHNLGLSRHYRLEYAKTLLLLLRPRYRPAWTAYMTSVLFAPWTMDSPQAASKSTAQYRVFCELLDAMHEEDIDVDEEQFRLFCTVLRYTADAAFRGSLPRIESRHVLSKGPHRVRTLFHTLVGANADTTPHFPMEPKDVPPPHVPGPTVLHAYVRALGMFRDYEGIYSFTTWATHHHTEVTARAHAQHSGERGLRRMLVAVRLALDGLLGVGPGHAPVELVQLVKSQVSRVEGWGGWPSDREVDMYKSDNLD